MEVEVLPTEHTEKVECQKSYDRSDLKSKEKSLTPADAPVRVETPIDRVWVELPILKCLNPVPEPIMQLTEEEEVTREAEDEFVHISSGDTQSAIDIPTPSQVEFMSQSPKVERILDPKIQIDIPEASVERPGPQPHYEYGSGLRNEMDPDSAFQMLLPQSVAESVTDSDDSTEWPESANHELMLEGSSLTLGHQFQSTTQHFFINKARATNIEVLQACFADDAIDSDNENEVEESDSDTRSIVTELGISLIPCNVKPSECAGKAVEVFQLPEAKFRKPRPIGPVDDLGSVQSEEDIPHESDSGSDFVSTCGSDHRRSRVLECPDIAEGVSSPECLIDDASRPLSHNTPGGGQPLQPRTALVTSKLSFLSPIHVMPLFMRMRDIKRVCIEDKVPLKKAIVVQGRLESNRKTQTLLCHSASSAHVGRFIDPMEYPTAKSYKSPYKDKFDKSRLGVARLYRKRHESEPGDVDNPCRNTTDRSGESLGKNPVRVRGLSHIFDFAPT